MSGGFFRGTSADQDTRFSNKKAKLLKSQKFPPELDHLVDATKVKMDVMRPWIANRATELLGFEDEVLINFIYGLLDGKAVNGKEVQISLTGFMEKNTGKFMKELWSLLLSAQKNASGVPQQFLDAKEEETRKKKDDDVDISRANNTALDPSSKYQPRAASTRSVDEKETNETNGSRGRSRVFRSSHSAGRSPSPPRGAPSRSVSKSFSNSRSHSGERHRSRSVSRSPETRGRSISSERVYRSPPGRSITPRRRHSPRRHVSPTRYRPYHSRRRSMSRSRRRSPSPVRRRRSPLRGISRSPVRRRSRSPRLYGSRRRSPSPVRRRSPSPIPHRSPSPVRRRYRRSSSTPRRRYLSPTRPRSPISGRRRSPTPPRRRSPLPQDLSSPSPVRRTSPSSIRRKSPKRQRRSPVESPRERIRIHEKYSPVRRAPPGENVELRRENRKRSNSSERKPLVSLRSPQRDLRDQNYSRREVPVFSPPPSESQSISKSPPAARKRSPSIDMRSSGHESPPKQTREHMTHGGSQRSPQKPREHKPRHENPKTSIEKEETNYAREDGDRKFKPSGKGSLHSSRPDEHKGSLEKGHNKDKHSPERVASHRSGEARNRPGGVELTKKEQEIKSEKISGRVLHSEVPDRRESLTTYKDTLASERQKESYPREGYKTDEKNHSHSNDVKETDRHPKSELVSKLLRKVEEDDQRGSVDSGSEENDKHRYKEKRKHKRSERQEVTSDDDYSYDSEIEERKEAKRRRKEEKKLKKEERRRRREERRRKREERRAQKLKLKSIDTVTPPSDFERNLEDSASDGERAVRRESRASDVEETESEQKRLEIELREKALESLRAKKGVHH